jgi:hypothetical protein
MELVTNGTGDEEMIKFSADLMSVWSSTLQSMPVIGPWLEERVRFLIKSWVPNVTLSNGQIYRKDQLHLRSRSWDIILCAPSAESGVGPVPPSPESGPPLVDLDDVIAVIDTKTNFSDVQKYVSQSVFNLANDATTPQTDFLGPSLPKAIFACSTNGNPLTLEAKGEEVGLSVFALGKYAAGPVSDGADRTSTWELSPGADGVSPLQRFKEFVQKAVRDRHR